jgi:hypothetical protein
MIRVEVINDIPLGLLGAAIQPILLRTSPWQPDFRVGFMHPPPGEEIINRESEGIT